MKIITPFLTVLLLLQCTQYTGKEVDEKTKNNTTEMDDETALNTDTITLGAGCVWCVEAIFEQLEGVKTVESGYSGGFVKNPAYREVCNGTTGHAEVCQLVYNPNVVSVEEILEVFFQTHDPTTLNRQGADVGTQYRSAIFYHNEKQRETAESIKTELEQAGVWVSPIVTEITEYSTFYIADDYHQEYFENNKDAPYCRAVIQPKVDKFQKVFKDRIKK